MSKKESKLDRLIAHYDGVFNMAGFRSDAKGIVEGVIFSEKTKEFAPFPVLVNKRKLALPTIDNMMGKNGKLAIIHPMIEIEGRGVSPIMKHLEAQSQVALSQLLEESFINLMELILDPKESNDLPADCLLLERCTGVSSKTLDWGKKVMRKAKLPNEKKRIVPLLSIHVTRRGNNDGHPEAVIRCRLLDELQSAVASRAAGTRTICGQANIPLAQVKAMLEIVEVMLDQLLDDEGLLSETYRTETKIGDYYGAFVSALSAIKDNFEVVFDEYSNATWIVLDKMLDDPSLDEPYLLKSSLSDFIKEVHDEVDPQKPNIGSPVAEPREPDVPKVTKREFNTEEGVAQGESVTHEVKEDQTEDKVVKEKEVTPEKVEAKEVVSSEDEDLPPWMVDEKGQVMEDKAEGEGEADKEPQGHVPPWEAVEEEDLVRGGSTGGLVLGNIPTRQNQSHGQSHSAHLNAAPVNRMQDQGNSAFYQNNIANANQAHGNGFGGTRGNGGFGNQFNRRR